MPLLFQSQTDRHERALTVLKLCSISPISRPFIIPIRTRNATVFRSAPTVMQSTNHLIRVLRRLSLGLPFASSGPFSMSRPSLELSDAGDVRA